MSTDQFAPLTPEELSAEGVTALPDKEVVSILDLAADINLAIDGAAPIDLAIALNANVVAPITGAVSANILANGSTSQALTDQGVMVTQHVNADAIATGLQDSTIDQSDTVTGGADATPADATPADATAAHPALLAATDAAGATAPDAAAAADAAPVDGSVVVDSAGHIVGTLDTPTGTVVDSAGNIIGTLNETTGLVVDSAGTIVGSVTDLIDGASVADATGNVIGCPRRGDRDRRRRLREPCRNPRPADRSGPQHRGRRTGHRDQPGRRHQRAGLGRQCPGRPRRCDRQRHRPAGNVIGALDPLTGQVLDAAGHIIGTVGQIVDDVTDTLGQLNTGDLLKGDLLNVDINVDLDADLAAPINGAVAANANVAAPIDASVSANILSDDSTSVAVADQQAIITQDITGTAHATSDQTSGIDQASIAPPDTDTASADDPAPTPATPAPATATTPAPSIEVPATAEVTIDPSTEPAPQ